MSNIIKEDLGIQIFEAAGFKVKVDKTGFALFKDGKKKYYHSNKGLLQNMESVVRFIKDDSRTIGIQRGVVSKQNEIKTALGILN